MGIYSDSFDELASGEGIKEFFTRVGNTVRPVVDTLSPIVKTLAPLAVTLAPYIIKAVTGSGADVEKLLIEIDEADPNSVGGGALNQADVIKLATTLGPPGIGLLSGIPALIKAILDYRMRRHEMKDPLNVKSKELEIAAKKLAADRLRSESEAAEILREEFRKAELEGKRAAVDKIRAEAEKLRRGTGSKRK